MLNKTDIIRFAIANAMDIPLEQLGEFTLTNIQERKDARGRETGCLSGILTSGPRRGAHFKEKDGVLVMFRAPFED